MPQAGSRIFSLAGAAGDLSSNNRAHGFRDNEFYNIIRGVKNSARFLDLGLLLDLGMCPVQNDDIAQEPLVNLSEDFRRHQSKVIEIIIETPDDRFQFVIADFQFGCNAIGFGGPIFFFPEMEEPGIITVIGVLEELEQPGVESGSIGKAKELGRAFDTAVLGNAEENDAINRSLDREVNFALIQLRIATRDIPANTFRQSSISCKKASSTSRVPFLAFLDSTNLSSCPPSTASREKMFERSSQCSA